MKKVILFDFDGTITRTDTLKFLLISFVQEYPVTLFTIVWYGVLARFSIISINTLKKKVIGKLLHNKSVVKINAVLTRYRRRVEKSLFPDIRSLYEKSISDGNIVLIATASPAMAIQSCFDDENLSVIGLEFEILNDVYTGKTLNDVPYGETKKVYVCDWMKQRNITAIDYAYSDSLSDAPVLELAQHAFLVGKDGELTHYHKQG